MQTRATAELGSFTPNEGKEVLVWAPHNEHSRKITHLLYRNVAGFAFRDCPVTILGNDFPIIGLTGLDIRDGF